MEILDRISLLPDCLLHEILSFLDSKSVVQTCVLSKRWKTLWTETPTLNFDFHNHPLQRSKGFSAKRFICRFLSQHRSKFIKKLSFSSSIHTDDPVLIVDFLLCYARHHTVHQLCLNTFDTEYFLWPLGLSTCSCLTVLKMKRYVDEFLAEYTPSLKILEIEFLEVMLMDPYLGKGMFSNCPNLESLVLISFMYDCFNVSAPKLENFELFSNSAIWELGFPEIKLVAPNLRSVKFTNTLPIVESASEFLWVHDLYIAVDDSDLDGDDLAMQKVKVRICKLLKVFHNARSFTLPLKAMEMILSDPSSLSKFSFRNLRYLKLKTEATNPMTNMSIGILMNLLHCPNLEKLEVDLNRSSYEFFLAGF